MHSGYLRSVVPGLLMSLNRDSVLHGSLGRRCSQISENMLSSTSMEFLVGPRLKLVKTLMLMWSLVSDINRYEHL